MDIRPILVAARSSDTTALSHASEALKQLENTNPPLFFGSLAEFLCNNAHPEDQRQLAGILIKNALYSDDDVENDKKHQRWQQLDSHIKAPVKKFLLDSLGASHGLARSAAAGAIAKVAAIELRLGQWKELVPGLLEQTAKPGCPPEIQHSMIMTMGYICEEVDQRFLSQDLITQILVCMTLNMAKEKPVPLQQIAASSMTHALNFAEWNFKDENAAHRDRIMSAICQATFVPDLTTRQNAFDCICKVASLYYSNLQPYMIPLFKLTTSSVTQEESIGIRALEFWNVLCEVEIAIDCGDLDEKNLLYVRGALKVLVPLVTSCMTKQTEDYDDDDFTLAMAASTCLALIAQATEDHCLPFIAEFVKETFHHADWHQRDAGALAIGSIMEGPSDEKLTAFVRHFTPFLLQALSRVPGPGGALAWKEPSTTVRDTTAWTLGKILGFRYHLIDPGQLRSIIDTLGNGLTDEPRVALNITYALHNLSDGLAQAGQHNQLSPFFPALLKQLVATSNRPDWDEKGLRDSCYTAMQELLKNAVKEDQEAVRSFMEFTMQSLDASLKHPKATPDDRSEQFGLQMNLCGTIHQLINKLAADVLPYAAGIMNLLIRVFQAEAATAHEEAFYSVGALANHIGVKFVDFMGDFHPYLLAGLKQHAEYQICATATRVLGDVCRAVEAHIKPRCDEYVDTLLQNLVNVGLNRAVKPPLLSVFGDIAVAIEADFERYLVYVVTMLSQAMKTKVPPDDEDLVEFLTELRHAILEAFTGIIVGFTDAPAAALKLKPSIEELAAFFQTVVTDLQDLPDYERDAPVNARNIKAMVGLMGDLATNLDRGFVLTYVNTDMPWVKEVLTWCNALEQADIRDGVLSAEQAITGYTMPLLNPRQVMAPGPSM